jgi:diguanylate cyclase (GGDEF)-like protein
MAIASPQWRRPADNRRASVLGVVAVLLILTVAVLWPTGLLDARPPGTASVPWWVMAILFGLAEVVVLHIQIRREAQTVSVNEVPLLIGLFFASPAALLIGRAVGPFLVFVLHRRQAPIKVVYNTVLVVASGSVALAVWAVVGGDSGLGPRWWLAGYAAAAAAGAFDAAVTTVVISFYEGLLRVRQLLVETAQAALFSIATATVGLVVATALGLDLRSAWLVAGSAALLLIGYRAYASLRERHESLERLYRFSHVVSGAHDVDAILRSVLAQAGELLRADRAEFLVLAFPGDVAAHRIVLLPDGGVEREALPPTEHPDPVAVRVLHSGSSVLLTRHTRDPVLKAYLDRRGLRDAVVVPLQMDGAVVGTLAVGNRMGEVRSFDHGDVRLLETVANHAGVALKSGNLIARLSHEAHHDSLTGLHNRVMLQQQMEHALASIRAGASPGCAVMISDLNGFKEVNDTLGHQHGDQLLREVAARFVAAAGERASVARLGGDEFAVLLTDVSDAEEALALAESLLSALRPPAHLDGMRVDVSASIGVALAPAHAEDASGLLKRADVAMYAAKASGDGVRIYGDELSEAANPRRLALLGELRHAIDSGQIEAYVQPKASLRDHSVVGVEALVRWRHPRDGIRLPGEFLPVAERNGMIRPLTQVVLASALQACASWRDSGLTVGVAVNLSPRSLVDRAFPDEVAAALDHYRVPPELLTLEITETSLMADSQQAIELLCQLSALGTRLSIDDFGTGYSSLSYLRRLPVSEVKIDREFVSRMTTDPDDLAIVRSVVDLARHLAIDVVAEGVENAAVWRQLEDIGCQIAQGYYLSRPIPAASFPAWLRSYEKTRAPIPHRRAAASGGRTSARPGQRGLVGVIGGRAPDTPRRG